MCNLPSLVEIILLIKKNHSSNLCYNTILTQLCQLICVRSITSIKLFNYKDLFCVTNIDFYDFICVRVRYNCVRVNIYCVRIKNNQIFVR